MITTVDHDTNAPPMEDSQLALEARRDAEAFAELYRRHVTRVYRYHLAHTGNMHDAEDLTSQTFIAALESIHTFRGSGSLAAWILGIASHKRLMFFRQFSRREESLEELHDIPDPGTHTDRAAMQQLEFARLHAAMRQLAPERREALALCYFAGLSVAEAACLVGKSESALRMLLSRGLHDLRTRTSVALEGHDE